MHGRVLNMKTRKKLFNYKEPYDTLGSNNLFIKAVRENVQWHYKNCADYRKILDGQNFSPDMLSTYQDLHKSLMEIAGLRDCQGVN